MNKREGPLAATGILLELKSLTTKQRSAVIAAFLGWTLDAFDFFIAVFVLSNIADDFNTTVKLSPTMRPVGALIFGLRDPANRCMVDNSSVAAASSCSNSANAT